MLKVQIVVTAHSFDEACAALSKLCGDEGGGLKGLLEAHVGVSIDEDRRVWLQQEGSGVECLD